MQVHLQIPLAHFQSVLSWDKPLIDSLADKAVGVAEKIGLRLDEEGAAVYLKEAESKGCRIDWPQRTALFRRSDIEKTIEVMRRTNPLPQPQRELITGEIRDARFNVGNGANLLFDWDKWQVKAPDKTDLVNLCRWAQGCDSVSSLWQPVMLKDIDQKLEVLYSYALMCKYCRKEVHANQATEPVHVKYLPKMFAVVEKHRGYRQQVAPWEYINPPFRLGLRGLETMLARVDTGACKVMGIGPMSVSGMSSPVTIAGHAVTALAEILAGLTFLRILRPGYGLKAVVCTGSLDLRTARVSYFGMHTHLGNLAAWELITRGLGVDAGTLTWYRDANEPGMQALYEFGMSQAFFSSVLNRSHPEIGGLCSGNMFSPEQAVLDLELVREFNELTSGFEVSEEALGLEEIVRARFEQGFHMSSEHTIRHMKDGIPYSGFLYRGLSAGSQHDKTRNQTAELMERAAESVRKDTEKGRAAEPDDKLAGELYEIVKEAAAEIGVAAPTLL